MVKLVIHPFITKGAPEMGALFHSDNQFYPKRI